MTNTKKDNYRTDSMRLVTFETDLIRVMRVHAMLNKKTKTKTQ